MADWSALKEAERVYILPDFDEPGLKYAYNVYRQIKIFKNLIDVGLYRFPIGEGADVCDYLKTIPELSDWNELDSLQSHPARETAQATLQQCLSTTAEPIPANWHFLVTKHKHKLISVNDFSHLQLPKRETILSPWLTNRSTPPGQR